MLLFKEELAKYDQRLEELKRALNYIIATEISTVNNRLKIEKILCFRRTYTE